MTPRAWEAHANELADLLDLHIQWIRPSARKQGFAFGRWRSAHVPFLDSEVAYATFLHEVGHVACEHRGGDEGKQKRTREIEAWEWARTHARWWTDGMSEHMWRCLNSYEVFAEHADAAELHTPVRG